MEGTATEAFPAICSGVGESAISCGGKVTRGAMIMRVTVDLVTHVRIYEVPLIGSKAVGLQLGVHL